MKVLPRWRVDAKSGGMASICDLSSGFTLDQKYLIGKERLSKSFGRKLPSLLDDLVNLAATVYVADRLVSRNLALDDQSGGRWQRPFDVHLAVADPARWNRPELRHLLSDALGFLTEDRWEFKFHPRDRGSSAPVQGILFPPETPVAASLFSGGLDSLAGLALQLGEGDIQTMVTLTCATSSRLRGKQKRLLRGLKLGATTKLMPIFLPVRLRQDRRSYNSNERSQRGRGFLYCVLGAVAALMAGSNELRIYENGVGAINLPLSDAQLGAQSSRATNPIALFKIEKFLRALLEMDFHIRLPYLFSTKGDVCRQLRESSFKDLAAQSISCDGFPRRSLGPEQCGTCTSCLLRRQALWVADFDEDCRGPKYQCDVIANQKAIPPARLAPLWDMLVQADRLGRALGSASPWEEITIEYPELIEVGDIITNWLGWPTKRADIRQRLISLYRSYFAEWHEFPGQPVGWSFSAPQLRQSA